MPEQYQLTTDERALIDELLSSARSLEQQAQGALRMICKVRGLAGNWNYDAGVMRNADAPALMPPGTSEKPNGSAMPPTDFNEKGV